MLRIAVSRGCCRSCRQSLRVCVESRIEQSSSVCCYSYYVESDNDAVDRCRSHFVIVRLEFRIPFINIHFIRYHPATPLNISRSHEAEFHIQFLRMNITTSSIRLRPCSTSRNFALNCINGTCACAC